MYYTDHVPGTDENTTGLSDYHVPGSVDTYYIPDFLTGDEESYVIRKVRRNVLRIPCSDSTSTLVLVYGLLFGARFDF